MEFAAVLGHEKVPVRVLFSNNDVLFSSTVDASTLWAEILIAFCLITVVVTGIRAEPPADGADAVGGA
ncbi:hypothetical protein ACFVX6_05495 [Streptomyces sp. NPDC058289]|uniref:hypothetical protein n=1 Tax=Streptomyces sp. NPDC058289 TaxID=3346425 RepID=UPI0036DFE375